MEDNYDREGANKNKLKYVLEKQVVGSSNRGSVTKFSNIQKAKTANQFYGITVKTSKKIINNI